MFTRKSAMSLALTLFVLLALVVPAMAAAPEQVTGVSIQAPTTANPFWVSSPGSFWVDYTVTVTGQQVTPVVVTFDLLKDQTNAVQPTATQSTTIAVGVLKPGANALRYQFIVPGGLEEGWYHLRVCINDGIDPYCAIQTRAVRIDNTGPVVVLERPVNNEFCTWVTGNKYELFGYATDNFQVARGWFEYTISPNNTPLEIPATPVAGFPGEYWAEWDSSEVPDTTPGNPGFIRFCAADAAGNVTCSEPWVDICIENRVKVDLEKGWNLISTPLLLYQPGVANVLENIWCPSGDPSCVNSGGWKYPADGTPINMIYTFRPGDMPWSQWVANGPDGIGAIEDGYGYWVHAVAPATIEFIGTWLSIGPVAPPEYAVSEGWNLIGYTRWGTPTDYAWNGAFCPTGSPCYGKLVSEYLGFPMMVSVESMYRYDAARGFYVMVDEFSGEQRMLQGAGYWLALAEGAEGTINP